MTFDRARSTVNKQREELMRLLHDEAQLQLQLEEQRWLLRRITEAALSLTVWWRGDATAAPSAGEAFITPSGAFSPHHTVVLSDAQTMGGSNARPPLQPHPQRQPLPRVLFYSLGELLALTPAPTLEGTLSVESAGRGGLPDSTAVTLQNAREHHARSRERGDTPVSVPLQKTTTTTTWTVASTPSQKVEVTVPAPALLIRHRLLDPAPTTLSPTHPMLLSSVTVYTFPALLHWLHHLLAECNAALLRLRPNQRGTAPLTVAPQRQIFSQPSQVQQQQQQQGPEKVTVPPTSTSSSQLDYTTYQPVGTPLLIDSEGRAANELSMLSSEESPHATSLAFTAVAAAAGRRRGDETATSFVLGNTTEQHVTCNSPDAEVLGHADLADAVEVNQKRSNEADGDAWLVPDAPAWSSLCASLYRLLSFLNEVAPTPSLHPRGEAASFAEIGTKTTAAITSVWMGFWSAWLSDQQHCAQLGLLLTTLQATYAMLCDVLHWYVENERFNAAHDGLGSRVRTSPLPTKARTNELRQGVKTTSDGQRHAVVAAAVPVNELEKLVRLSKSVTQRWGVLHQSVTEGE